MANNGPHYAQGTYVCEVTSQALGESEEKHTPFFALKFKVLGTVNHEDPDTYDPAPQQYERTMWLYLTEGTMKFAVEKLATLGFSGRPVSHLSPSSPNFFDMSGRVVRMFCKHEPNNKDGGMRERWDVARDSASTPLDVKPLDSRKLRELDALFGKQAKEMGIKPAARPVAVPAGAGDAWEPGADDDVAF